MRYLGKDREPSKEIYETTQNSMATLMNREYIKAFLYYILSMNRNHSLVRFMFEHRS